MIEIITLLIVLAVHHVGEPPLPPVQACAPQLVTVTQVDGKIVLKGVGQRICFADIRG